MSRSRIIAIAAAVVAWSSSCGLPQVGDDASAAELSAEGQELRKARNQGHHHFQFDAGTPDAGTTSDAGSGLDAGASTDAGASMDAGSDAGPATADAGTGTDGGNPDGGKVPVLPNTVRAIDTTLGAAAPKGCGCATSSGASLFPLVGLLLLAVKRRSQRR